MNPKNSIKDRKQPVAGWHFVALGGVVVAVAMFIALPTWSAMSAEVISGQRSDTEVGGRQADKLAREHGAWLREAHSKTHRNADVQPLPAQF